MNEIDRYLKRATRGLWGQKKRDAQAELRGAVEDKMYRCRLLGLNEAQAVASALRELGSPAVIARELNAVHSLPQTLKVVAFVGVAGLLGLQAAAQVAVVNSSYLPPGQQLECQLPSSDRLAQMSAAERQQYERLLAAQGGPDEYLKQCRRGGFSGFVLLKVNDLLTALRAGGVTVADQADATPKTPLFTFGPNGKLPTASFTTLDVEGQRYLPSSMLITFLKGATSVPLKLVGLTNPVLSVGQTQLQLGTSDAPVRATDLLASTLGDARLTNTSLPLPTPFVVMAGTIPRDPAAPKLTLPGQEGDFYAVVQNLVDINGGKSAVVTVDALNNGTVNFATERNDQAEIVSSLDALDAATASRQKAVLVYRLDASNLRDLKLTPLNPTQVKVVQP